MRIRSALRAACAVVAAACAGSCARAQTVLEIDTDVPVPRMGDSVRVDVLRDDGTVIESRTFFAGNRQDWPLSFGLTADASTRVRVRLFFAAKILGARRSATGVDAGGAAAMGDAGDEREPLVESSIDRLVVLDRPTQGVRRVRVLLRGDCMGVPADLANNTTCTSASTTNASAAIGDGDERTATSLLGTWTAAIETDCAGQPRADSALRDGEACIKGGAFFLGDERVGSTPCEPNCGASPERIVKLSPFFMDRYEVTVARWRAAMARGFRPQFNSWNASDACTARTPGADPDLPINCVSVEDARAFCQWDGGRDLPTEAQFEFAATGRGREREYVWGSALPDCTFASYARFRVPGSAGATFGNIDECTESGEGPSLGAMFEHDRTDEGVYDLAANLGEWTRDALERFDRGCWARQRYGLLVDPVCDQSSTDRVRRGGSWGHASLVLSPNWRAAIPIARIRTTAGELGTLYGFRCVRRAL
ncbi:MAG: SUMF1/EgtB/PvdO family nonheme iron enzyme [Polyangiales bacterium]